MLVWGGSRWFTGGSLMVLKEIPFLPKAVSVPSTRGGPAVATAMNFGSDVTSELDGVGGIGLR